MPELRAIGSLLLCVVAGCATTTGDDAPLAGGGAGGKGDDATVTCDSDDMIAAARHWAIVAGPDELRDENWSTGSVDAIEDLDGDGARDLLILPGHFYAGANVATVLAFSGGPTYGNTSCRLRFAGYFAGVAVNVAEDRARTRGVLDVVEVNVSACESASLRWKFDGTIYAPTDDIVTQDVCN